MQTVISEKTPKYNGNPWVLAMLESTFYAHYRV